MGTATTTTTTSLRILDVAERLVQTHGFNGFSYADIATKLKIRKPSLHHHYATKADLGVALLVRYHATFFAALATLDSQVRDPAERLERYVALYRQVLVKDRMCLCGMLAAELATLPKPMRQKVNEFFTDNEAWVARLLDEGRRAKKLRFDTEPPVVAQQVICTLEGAMLVARSHNGVSLFDAVAQSLLRELMAA